MARGESGRGYAASRRPTACWSTTSRSTASPTRWSTRRATRARLEAFHRRRSTSSGPKSSPQRFDRADQYLRDAGVFYRIYDKAGAQRARLAAGACAADHRRDANGRRSPPGWCSAPSCSRRSSPTSTAPNRLVGDGLLPPGLIAAQPRIPAADGRHQAGAAAISCISAPSSSAAVRMAAGGCSATARRRLRAPALRSKTASPPRARCPTSTARCTCIGSPASSATSATRCIGMAAQDRRPRRHPDARAAQRDLFRARLYRPLSRLHAARGRGSDRRRTAR